jgi:peptide deformylase
MPRHLQRSPKIRVKAQNVEGRAMKYTFFDWHARVLLHEYDHLQGVLFPDRMSDEELRRERPLLERLEKEYTSTHRTFATNVPESH